MLALKNNQLTLFAPNGLYMNTILHQVELRENRETAERLVVSLMKLWPSDYVIRESKPDSETGSSSDGNKTPHQMLSK